MQPMRVGEILDRSFALIPHLLRRLIWFILIIAALSTGVAYLNLEAQRGIFAGILYFALIIPASLVQWLVHTYFYLLFTYLCADAWLGKDYNLQRAQAQVTFGIFFKSLLMGLRVGFTTMFLCLLFIIPGLIYFVNRIPAFYILLLEQKSISESLKQAKTLMTHHPGIAWYSFHTPMMRVSGIMLITMVLSFLPGLISGVGMGFNLLHPGSSETTLFDLLLLFTSQALSLCCTFYGYLALIGFYYDLRTRYEGLDIAQELAAICPQDS